MAGSLLLLLDDIASVLDDVALLTKVATKKTAGVLGDDLALNAQQVTGVSPERELPVVWAVAMGSAKNKLILVPAALLLSAVAPAVVTPLLMLGGLYLCFEGCEKLVHRFLHHDEAPGAGLAEALADPSLDLVAFEQERIAGAIRTDFVLSAEIVAITLGTVAGAGMTTRLLVLSGIAAIMTVGVYGLVAAIVKLDDLGLHLSRRPGASAAVGKAILVAAPRMMKGLSVVGTAAMFLVGGGILSHGIAAVHDLGHALEHHVAQVPAIGGALAGLTPLIFDAGVGVVAGAIAVAAIEIGRRWWPPTPRVR